MNRTTFLSWILAFFGLDACQYPSPQSPSNGMMGGMMSSMGNRSDMMHAISDEGPLIGALHPLPTRVFALHGSLLIRWN